MNVHPEALLFQCLPAAGAALAPRLVAFFGSNRDSMAARKRWPGLPVSHRSGNEAASATGFISVLAPNISRVGFPLCRPIGVGSCLLRWATGQGQRAPCGAAGPGIQVDSYFLPVLERQQAVRRKDLPCSFAQARFPVSGKPGEVMNRKESVVYEKK